MKLTILSTLLSIVGALLMLCALVFVHELGHFSAGRAFGFGIREFAIGFGPKLFSRVGKDDIRYSVRVFPLGGYCAFYGEDEVPNADDPRALNNQKAWKRFIMQLAGPAANILFALLLSVVFVNLYGSDTAVVKTVEAASAAQAAGVQPGDVIRAVEGQPVYDFELASAISSVKSPELRLSIERDGQPVELTIARESNPDGSFGKLGIGWDRLKLPFLQSFGAAWRFCFNAAKEIAVALVSLFVKPQTIMDNVSGPVGTIAVIGQSIVYGFRAVLLLSLLLSVNLGLFNLLPIPGLDGGRMVFTAVEMLIRRPVPRRIEGAIHAAGFALLMAFIIFLTYGDISRIVQGG